MDVPAVAARQLVEPDVRAARDQDNPRHPLGVGAEPLGLRVEATERRGLDDATEAAMAAPESEVHRPLLLGQHVEADEDPLEQVAQLAQQCRPAVADIAQLARQRRGRGDDRRTEHRDERQPTRLRGGPGVEQRLEACDDDCVVGRLRQRRVVEQFPERLRGRIAVLEREEQQLLERLDAIAHRSLGRGRNVVPPRRRAIGELA